MVFQRFQDNVNRTGSGNKLTRHPAVHIVRATTLTGPRRCRKEQPGMNKGKMTGKGQRQNQDAGTAVMVIHGGRDRQGRAAKAGEYRRQQKQHTKQNKQNSMMRTLLHVPRTARQVVKCTIIWAMNADIWQVYGRYMDLSGRLARGASCKDHDRQPAYRLA